MAYTQQEYNTLKSAVTSGVLEVWYVDRRVKYQDLGEMRKLLAEMEAQLNGVANGRSGGRYMATSKGV